MRFKTHTLTEAGFTHVKEPIERWDLREETKWLYTVRTHETMRGIGRNLFWGWVDPPDCMVMIVEDFTKNPNRTNVIKFLYQ